MKKNKYKVVQETVSAVRSVKADALTGFIAGFLVGIIGMYVYAVIMSNLGL